MRATGGGVVAGRGTRAGVREGVGARNGDYVDNIIIVLVQRARRAGCHGGGAESTTPTDSAGAPLSLNELPLPHPHPTRPGTLRVDPAVPLKSPDDRDGACTLYSFKAMLINVIYIFFK